MATITDQQMLDSANYQYHLLLTGQAVRVFVDQNGERVEYTPASATKLRQYIDMLTARVNGSPMSSPLVPWFG